MSPPSTPIYLDHNASTPPAPEVVEAMMPWLTRLHANPHSEHRQGRHAAQAVEQARASVAALIGADADDIFFTSGATEANNLILQGVVRHPDFSGLLLVGATEHRCILETAAELKYGGAHVEVLPVDMLGRIQLAILRRLLQSKPNTRSLVSVMHANNEIGTIADLRSIAEISAPLGALLHTDAAQSVGTVAIDVARDSIDFLTLSSHKIYGPAGIGAAYIASDLQGAVRPLMFGGGQQAGIRPGTLPVFLCVGFGTACDVALQRRASDAAHLELVAEAFINKLRLLDIPFNLLGDLSSHLPGLRSVEFVGSDASVLLERISALVSAGIGSACSSGELKESHVLQAIGLDELRARSVARFGFGRDSPIGYAALAAMAIEKAVR